MKYFDNQFLFSETYINNYIKDNSKKLVNNDEDLDNMFRNIVEWNKEFTTGDSRNDSWENYIDEILDVIGFQNKKIKNNVRVLYTNPLINGEKPVSICYCIDKDENVDSTTKGKYYAYDAVKVARDNNVEWAILTNGYKWRIYSINNISPYEYYLEIDIEASIKENGKPNEAFQLFYLFFNVKTYYTEDEQLIIEKIKDKSDKTAETIEEFLRGKSEEILKDLCYGLKENINKQVYSEEDRKNIYNDAIILLYRLLFFGYAESRGLLPIVDNDPDYPVSFEKLCYDAKEMMNSEQYIVIKDGFEFWGKLDSHLRVYVDNSYNGGLFHNEDKNILKEHRIANEHLIKCLAEISYNKDKNGKYTSKIEYKDLSVRNLGAIYEGLLEYRLFIAEERMIQRKNKNKVSYIKAAETTLKTGDLKNIIEKGGIYLSQDAMERKETGAYYTPEDVVEYIVDNTVGKKIGEQRGKLKDMLKPYYDELQYQSTEQGKRTIQNDIDSITYKFINENILSLSIIDSAMGSGHFLVNAAYRVSNEIVSIIEDNNWQSIDEIPVDIKEWKRKVVENCIYGIDINELSVALARLSLWLISASNDKALSFIDHHLKTGDSIIGATKAQVKHVSDEKIIKMFDVLPDSMLEPIIRKFDKIKEIGSSTKYDVEMQKAVYKQIEEELNLIKIKFDYYLAIKYAGGIEDKDENDYIDLMKFGVISDFEKLDIKLLMKYARENRFFHWELEFPQVFANGGFDAAIGNPPYVDVETGLYSILNLSTVNCRNLYAYMFETNLKMLCKDGSIGMIVPLSSTASETMQPLQKLITSNVSKLYISTFDSRPSKIFMNADQRISIIIGSLSSGKSVVYTTKYNRWYTRDRKKLFNSLEFTRLKIAKNNYGIYKIGSSIENSTLSKLLSTKMTMGNYVVKESDNVLYYHSAVRYWLKCMDSKPEFYKGGINVGSSKYKSICIKDNINKYVILSLINSSLFYWYWIISSDCRDLNKSFILEFPFEYETINQTLIEKLEDLGTKLIESNYVNSELKEIDMKSVGKVEYRIFYPKYSKKIIDEIDLVIKEMYLFTEEEYRFITNYDVDFRMGNEEE